MKNTLGNRKQVFVFLRVVIFCAFSCFYLEVYYIEVSGDCVKWAVLEMVGNLPI